MLLQARTLFILLMVSLGGPALAQEAGELGGQDRGAIRQVIESQLAAFQRDDAAGAFAFASPKIQQMFGDPATFMTMVRTGYEPVYRPRRFEFLDLRALQGQPAQEVFFVGPDGREVLAIYVMDRQPDGSWRIDGVYLVRPEDQTT